MNSVGMTDVGVFFPGAKPIRACAQSTPSLVQRLIAYRCENYRLLKLLDFLPVPCLMLPFMCQQQGVAWHVTSSTWLPGVDLQFCVLPVFINILLTASDARHTGSTGIVTFSFLNIASDTKVPATGRGLHANKHLPVK